MIRLDDAVLRYNGDSAAHRSTSNGQLVRGAYPVVSLFAPGVGPGYDYRAGESTGRGDEGVYRHYTTPVPVPSAPVPGILYSVL